MVCHLPVSAYYVQLPQFANRSASLENTVLLAKSAIELLSEIVEWVIGRVLEDVVDDIINVVCAYLRTDMCGIYEEAAKCLWKLASRKRAKTDETPIVVSMFKETPMQTILSAAR